MKTTKKLLSVLMAIMMIFSAVSLSASAIDWPKDLSAGAVTFVGTSKLASAEFAIGSEYTTLEADAQFTVYFSEEKAEDIIDFIGLEEVGKVGADNAYLAEGVIHVNLSSLEIKTEGYYYINVSGGAVTGEDCQNISDTTDGVLYQFASLGLFEKISAIFNYVISIVGNLISNGKPF